MAEGPVDPKVIEIPEDGDLAGKVDRYKGGKTLEQRAEQLGLTPQPMKLPKPDLSD